MPAVPTPAPEPPNVEFTGKTHNIVLYKQQSSSKLGIVLAGVKGHPPIIKELKEGAVSATASIGLIKVGYTLVSVNGENVYGHEIATAKLKAAQGDLRLVLGVSGDPEPPQPSAAAEEPMAETPPAEPPATDTFRVIYAGQLTQRKGIKKTFPTWHNQISEWKAKAPFRYTSEGQIVDSAHIKPFHKDELVRPVLVGGPCWWSVLLVLVGGPL
jgi:hypothetical protein